MSNLGLYQDMTTFAKKVGGPIGFIGVVAAGGYVVLRTIEGGIKAVISKKPCKVKGMIFTVMSSATDEQGLSFAVGEQFRVLESDRNAIQIEKIGDLNNQYFVSAEFLRSISDFTE